MSRIVNITIYCAVCIILCTIYSSCRHESFDEKVAREAREYTARYCPTPNNNYTCVDSMVYDNNSRTLINYCRAMGYLDNDTLMAVYEDKVSEGIMQAVKSDPTTEGYRKNGIAIRYVVYPESNPNKIWIDVTIK